MSSVAVLLLEIALVVAVLWAGDRWARRTDRREWQQRVTTTEARIQHYDALLANPNLTPAQRRSLEQRKRTCEDLIAGPAWHWSHT